MFLKRLSLVFALLVSAYFLSACQGSPLGNVINSERYYTFQDVMQTWVGSDIDKLVSSWGTPTTSYQKKDGSLIYTWKEFHESAYNYGYCNQSFLVNTQGIVAGWKFDGYCPYNHRNKTVPKSIPIPRSSI